MRRSVVPVLMTLALVAGCGAVPGTGNRVARGGLPSSPAPSSPAPSPTASFDRAAVSARAKAASIGHGALLKVGGPSRAEDEPEAGYRTSHYCDWTSSA
jgi:hypothetical protein